MKEAKPPPPSPPPQRLRRADYYLYSWQIRAIRRLSAAHGESPSALMRRLLSEAIAAHARPLAPAKAENEAADVQ